MKKCREKDPFKFHALLFQGEQTGYAKCTYGKCHERIREPIFQVQEQNRDGLIKRLLLRHLNTYHVSDEEISERLKRTRELQQRARNQRATSSQRSMDSFVQVLSTRKLNEQVVKELRSLNAGVIAGNDLSLDFFASEEMIARDSFLLQSNGVDPDEVHRFNKGSTGIKNDLLKTASANRQLISSVVPELAKHSRLATLVDHQKILHLTNETNADALGFGLVLSATDNKRYSFLLGFEAVESTRNADTVHIAREIAQERIKTHQCASRAISKKCFIFDFIQGI